MKRMAGVLGVVLGVFALFGSGKSVDYGDWCPKGKSLGKDIYVEGIVDYEGKNWCKVVVRTPYSVTEVYYTPDGSGEKVVKYKNGKKMAEIELVENQVYLRLYDKNGKVVEEIKSREEF
ncbi:hypothetical protein [Aquifex aeolicus]|uniref:Uncharacterized protein aq_914 n=1 Tax=Aquifex aeolicus (strain VF5) TaxID=224324 RepID=Y914_AQUAE|nr:hypothetical protein [Aquifex aeolicus]O67059.1 RecName: Full=Uncharacterized protein aq_914 [Aquifex aeolicus VF5]AAC07021.1 putative protein [Aquifex aeolicus VF5]